MRKSLHFILFILCISNIYSQESTNLALLYNGYKDNQYKEIFIANNLPDNSTEEDVQKLSEYYDQNEKEILTQYDFVRHTEFLEKYNKDKEEANNSLLTGVNIALNAVATGIAEGQKQEAINKQREAEKEAQLHAEQQARVAQNKQKYAEFQAMTNRKVHSSDYQSNSSSYNTQGSYNDLLTSDPNRNTAVQQSVQAYGIDATRNAINEAKVYDAQSKATGGYGGQVISAVTSNRQAIKIQVRERKIGGRIVAYSLGGDAIGQQQWKPTDGIISKCTSNYEYAYTAYIQGLGNIYFDL